MIIRFNPLRLLRAFVPFFVLVAISLILNFKSWQNAPSWTFWVFGMVAGFLVFSCLVMPKRYFLKLQPEGLTIQYLTYKRIYSWQDIRNFRVIHSSVNHVPFGEFIGFDLTPDSVHRTKLTRLANASRKLQMLGRNGYDVSIFAVFDLSGNELVNLLNDWQSRYVDAV